MKSISNIASRFFTLFLECLPPAAILTLFTPSMIINNSVGYIAPLETWIYLAAVWLWLSFLGAIGLTLTFIKVDPWLKIFLRSLFILSFLITVFYPEGGRRLDGVAAVTPSLLSAVLLYLIYIAVFALIFFACHRYRDSLHRVFTVLCLICFCFVSYVGFNQVRADNLIANKEKLYIDKDTDLTYGKDHNIIFIIADMLQGSIVEQYFGKYPEMRQDFQGFTTFTRAISPFPFTNYGVPAMLSGKIYPAKGDNNLPYNWNAIQTNSLLVDAQQKGFKSTVIGMKGLTIHQSQKNYKSNITPERLATSLIELSCTRISKIPILFKIVRYASFHHITTVDLLWLISLKVESAKLLSQLSTEPVGSHPKKVQLIHNFIPHTPVAFQKSDAIKLKNNYSPLKLTPDTVIEELDYFFIKISELIKHLKKIGVYENSMIVITGDHGSFIGNEEEIYNKFPGAKDFRGYVFGNWARSAAMYNPAILIKPANINTPMKMSHKSISLTNLRELIGYYLNEKHKKLEDTLKKGYDDKVHEVVVFKEKTTWNPYNYTADHHILKLNGNVSNLPDVLMNNDTKK